MEVRWLLCSEPRGKANARGFRKFVKHPDLGPFVSFFFFSGGQLSRNAKGSNEKRMIESAFWETASKVRYPLFSGLGWWLGAGDSHPSSLQLCFSLSFFFSGPRFCPSPLSAGVPEGNRLEPEPKVGPGASPLVGYLEKGALRCFGFSLKDPFL